MKEEIFDVVDAADRVIGQETRSEVHRRGLQHRAVHVLVFNCKGQVFLQKRSNHKDTHPGTWDSSASGHLASGEDYSSCAMRELAEEIGVTLSAVPQPQFKVTACAETGQEHVCVYRVEAEGPFAINPEEIEAGAWFDPQEVDARLARSPEQFAPAFQYLWQRFSAAASRPQ